MYQKGDYVVKANAGICRIDDIVEKKMTDEDPVREYYVLIPLDDGKARFFIPTVTESPAIRMAMNEEMAWELIKSIPDISFSRVDNDRLRERIYKDALRSNEPAALVSIIKIMHERRRERELQGKKATAIDERYFRMAEKLLYSELAHALGKESTEMSEIIIETTGAKL